MIYDVIIIGAGAGGLTAGLYSSRRNLKTLVISKDLGGQTAIATEIENYPGVLGQPNGAKLMQDFKKQAISFGAEIKLELVNSIEPPAPPALSLSNGSNDSGFVVKTEKEKYETKTIILAFGLSHRELGVKGEKEFAAKGVAYCATCDAPFFKQKTVAVVGGGNSGLDAAELLSGIAKKVYLIHRGESFTAESVLQKNIQKAENIEVLLNSEIKEIKGQTKVESIIIANAKEKEIKVDGVFVQIGYAPKTDWLKDLVKINQKGEVITDENCRTSHPGIFAAGDVTDAPYKQIVISAGEGAKAALQAYDYIKRNGGLNKETPDWGRNK
ncbi:FAD-dependent oxidoreductase [Candidatus Falkowbacteria bacterium]|nr:FAD-dependent oxidoreductase [Candidatus Falkowbacteria bacterium]